MAWELIDTMREQNEPLPADLCPHLGACGIVQGDLEKMPGLVERFKQNYCLGNHAACCRRWVWDFLGVEKVPELMLPHQRDWAQQLLSDSGIGPLAFRRTFLTPHRDKSSVEK